MEGEKSFEDLDVLLAQLALLRRDLDAPWINCLGVGGMPGGRAAGGFGGAGASFKWKPTPRPTAPQEKNTGGSSNHGRAFDT